MGLWLCKARRFLDAHKERILSLLFFVLEAVSVMLDQFGENNVRILLVAFLLSIVGCAITLYSIIVARHDETIMEKIQLLVVEIVFSGIQLLVAFFHYLLTVLQLKNDYNAAPFPLAFAGISVWFTFKKGRRITDALLPISNVSNPPDGSSPTGPPPGSTPINESESSTETHIEFNEPITTEPEQIMTSTSQVNPPATTVKRRTLAGKQIKKIIFSKHLTRSDIASRLHIPTSALEHIEIPEGDNKVDLMVRDSAGLTWPFRLYTRRDGHPKPAITTGWLDFVRAKDLRIGDEVTFGTMQEDEAGGAPRYMIRARRAVLLFGQRTMVDL